jgi:hypothetical protein
MGGREVMMSFRRSLEAVAVVAIRRPWALRHSRDQALLFSVSRCLAAQALIQAVNS